MACISTSTAACCRLMVGYSRLPTEWQMLGLGLKGVN